MDKRPPKHITSPGNTVVTTSPTPNTIPAGSYCSFSCFLESHAGKGEGGEKREGNSTRHALQVTCVGLITRANPMAQQC